MSGLPHIETILENWCFPSRPFSVTGCSIDESSKPITLENLEFRYGNDAKVDVLARNEADIIQAFQQAVGDPPELKINTNGGQVEVFWTNNEGDTAPFLAKGDTRVISHRFCLNKSPCLAHQSGAPTTLEMYAVNLVQLEILGGSIESEIDGLVIKITQIFEKKSLSLFTHRITHRIDIKEINGGLLDTDKAFDLIYRLGTFLTLASGQLSGIGHVLGKSASERDVLLELGFRASDPQLGIRNWFTLDPGVRLKTALDGFLNFTKIEENFEVLSYAASFYRTANVIEKTAAREVALISSCSGLECFSSFILRGEGGWSGNQFSNSSLANRLSAALEIIGLSTDIFEHCENLTSQHSSLECSQLELLIKYRNKIVHADRNFEYNGLQLLEAFNVFQWLLEQFFFYCMDYRYGMVDRRKWSGRTKTVRVPLDDGTLS